MLSRNSLRCAFGILALFLLGSVSGHAQKFFPDDPAWVDKDKILIPQPQEWEVGIAGEALQNTFMLQPPGGQAIPRAENINTLGEVPDSSWFTNRIGRRSMTLEEIVRGPDQLNGPDLSKPWKIVKSKPSGVAPGFVIEDARGDTYFVKFDPAGRTQMATSAEVIATKFFYTFGYNVPENYVAFITRKDLEVDSKATIKDENGRVRKMTSDDMDHLLKKLPKLSDGRIPALASRALSGKPIGPFKYWETRPDDPNDIFRHENRRELRGLRVFAAWLHHFDVKSENSLDVFIAEENKSDAKQANGDAKQAKGFVKHNLLDFGSTLGSGGNSLPHPRSGYEHIMECLPMLKTVATLGLWDRPYFHLDFPESPAVGRFEADFFDPAKWKPSFPNPAFQRMLPEDAFWATKIVMRFTDDMVRALVKTGQYADPGVEKYIADTLIKRRDKVIHHYLSQLNPLDDFRIRRDGAAASLEFTNYGEKAGLTRAPTYTYRWFRFDNKTQSLHPLNLAGSTGNPSIPIPGEDVSHLMAEISTVNPDQPAWAKQVHVFVRNGAAKEVVGIEREN